MARYIQDPVSHKLVPADTYFRPQTFSHSIHGFHEPYVSPVDGSIISDAKSLREHNVRNNVVQTSEFGTKHWDIKRKERERFFNGEYTSAESWKRKAEINEAINRATERAK